jgi:malonate decarboxylase beta subunit
MTKSLHVAPHDRKRKLRDATPGERIDALADPGTVELLPPAGASPHLARYGIAARDDDGVTLARVRVHGAPMLVAAQDEQYLAGSVGERHGRALHAMAVAARHERPAAIVLLLASGGVRLHEANAAELALARALSALLDARIDGIPVVAVGVGSVFGGASVLAGAADRLALLPGTRIGLSGPKVLESVHGKWQLDADDAGDVDAVYGAAARNASGVAELVVDDAEAVRAWVAQAARERDDYRTSVVALHRRLGARIAGEPALAPAFEALPIFDGAASADAQGWLWARTECWLTRPSSGATLGPADAHALDAALLAHVAPARASVDVPLVLLEDSDGHAVSRAAEMRFVSQYLAHHASVLALLRGQGRRLIGLLTGTGHSAAFFSNALQAPTLYALATSRVVAMEPAAMARVTGLPAGTLIDDDPLLGQPVRHFAAQGGVAEIVSEASVAALHLAA